MQIILSRIVVLHNYFINFDFSHNIQKYTIVPIAQITGNELNAIDKAFNDSIAVEVWVSVKKIIIHANSTLQKISRIVYVGY